jgi:hypothetical protein
MESGQKLAELAHSFLSCDGWMDGWMGGLQGGEKIFQGMDFVLLGIVQLKPGEINDPENSK